MSNSGNQCIDELFEAQAARTPDALALVCGSRRLSYAELNGRANGLAAEMRREGAGPGTLVAICLGRTEWLVIAVLAALKTGAAYVPLDPAYPRERMEFILGDSGAPLLVAEPGMGGLGTGGLVRRIDLDGRAEERFAIGEWSDANAPRAGSPRDLAYVIYTSGSTGRPKGVAIEHRNATALIRWAWGVYGPEELAGVLAATSVCFDLSIFELFVPLTCGGAVILAANALALPELPARGEVTLINTVPSAIRELVRMGGVPDCVRVVNLAGEPLTAALADEIYAKTRVRKVCDLYGPSETTTYSTYALRARGGPAIIGRPIAGTGIELLDEGGRPAAVGVAGEIYIGGAGVARGYLNRPELTAERFVDDPLGGGGRFYKTGDLARWRTDGELEFIGRVDFQLKIRGYRIEPGEIEAALRECAGVRDAVVVGRDDANGEVGLVAYMAGDGGPAATEGLRKHLAGKLPEYMTPAAFVWLAALPLTANGKVDRKALPEPKWPESGVAGRPEFIAPRGGLEQKVAKAWEAVLGVDAVGATDNFFELGGHSLLAIRVVSRLREELHLELPLRSIFEHRTVAGLAGYIEALQSGSAVAEMLPPILPAMPDRSAGGKAALSFAQQRLWFLDQLSPGSAAYNIPEGYRLVGRLDGAALEAALGEIVRRHESLRTVFAYEDESAVQVIRPAAAEGWRLEIEDLSRLDESARREALKRFVREEGFAPFDLRHGPLMRTRLLKLGDNEHVLLLTIHHIVSDGWSMGVLARELSASYGAYSRGAANPLRSLLVQYADFALWQRGWLAGARLQRQLDYWKTELAGVPPLLELSGRRPASDARGRVAREFRFAIPADLTQALSAMSRRNGATMFMTLLAVFETLLHRCAGSDDFVIGTALAGRNNAETEGLIGFFVNTLPVRARIEEGMTFQQLLAGVRENVLAMLAHQDLPFERLVEAINPGRNAGDNPLFSIMFTMDDGLDAKTELHGLQTTRLEAGETVAKFDLTLTMAEIDGRLEGWFVYDTDLFEEADAARMAGQLQRLAESAAAEPETRVAALTLISESERRLLDQWNATETDFPAHRTVDALFAEQAARNPEAVAIRFGEETIRYDELDLRANGLAARLRDLGCREGSRVVVCLERSPAFIVAILAVLKAGGAYVPIEPPAPAERLSMILEDAGASIIVTEKRYAQDFAEASGRHVIAIDEEVIANANLPPAVSANGESAAYIIYTSGSTGRPKGSVIPHRAISRLIINTDYVQLQPDDAVAQAATIEFDAATFEIWGALLNGARIVIVEKPAVLSARALSARIEQEGITTLFLTTALFNHLSIEDPSVFRGLRHLLFGGEACDPARVRAVLAAGAPARLLHVYGPTETTAFATWHLVKEVPDSATTIPIGGPIANTHAYVLDDAGALVGAGVVGELSIGGPGVALGYLNRPELTAERFADDHFRGAGQLYKTGDMVRWRDNGSLEFIGRRDFQFKIRGYRIEPGEIEVVLREHPDLRDVVVVGREDASGEKRLVAYLVGDGATKDTGALRSYLKCRMPDFMVPSIFVWLDVLPLTANGKVDRKALPEPEWGAALGGRHEYIAPRNDTEGTVAKAWEGVLGIDTVGALDNFFELGGHSLLAIRVVSKLREQLDVELPLRSLFTHQSVESLAAFIESQRAGNAPVELLPAIQPSTLTRSAGGKAPVSFAQQRLWFLDQLSPGSSAYNIPEGFRLSGRLDSAALQSALSEIVRRHESLRTIFAYENESPVQVICPAGADGGWKLAIEDLGALGENERREAVARIAREEAFTSFDLQRGPLMRTRLLKLGAEEHVLLLTIHHIISDGWSMGVLARELSALYGAYSRGEASPLQPLPVQYPDFAQWQRQLLTGPRLLQQLDYWKTQLAGDLAPLSLPTDFPRPEDLSDRAGECSLELTAELTASLKALCREQRVTLFMLLLAAFDLLLHRLSGSEDILVGSPAAGRNRTEIEGLIGFFVNTLVLRADHSGNPTFRELLGRVREVTLGAYEHQDIPFEKLVEELNPERRLGHTPFFQVMLNLLNVTVDLPVLDGFSVESIPFEQFQSKFDLTLYVTDAGPSLGLKAVYNASLFTAQRIGELLAQMQAVLEQAAVNSGAPISTMSLLTPGARAVLPDPAARIDAEKCGSVIARLGLWAAQTPGKSALAGRGGAWTYRALDEFTNRAARWLQERGVQAEDVVAIWAARESSLAAAMLAVWKAGAAFVILDPDHPESRLLDCVRIAKPKAWIECAESPRLPAALAKEAASALGKIRIPAAESAAAIFESGPAGALPLAPPPGAGLAYVAFTSGTTGRPKAIAGEHQPVSHFLAWHTAQFAFTADARFSVLSGLGHDPLLRDIMAPLYVGASACFPPADSFDRPDRLRAWLREEGITAAHITPALAALITAQLGPGALPALQHVFIGGDVLRQEIVREIRAAAPSARCINFYGATETPQAMAWFEVPQSGEAPEFPRGIPIGRGIDAAQILLLTESQALAGIGEPGEICVRTPFLARGYLDDAALTAASFVANPFTNLPGDRIYKTGDFGIYRPDGNIEYLGRRDRQVKIRGYRIEPAEIEAALREHPGIREAAVVARAHHAGDNQLVAYLVGAEFDPAEMRAFLKPRLPDSMIPSFFVRLDALPLTRGGKLDRKALPAPETAGAATGKVSMAPRDDLELRLVRIWEDVLKIRGIGVRDDFFDLGGHSLLGVSLLARIEKAFSKRLPLSAIFEARNVERLSTVLRHEGWVSSWYSMVPIQPCGSRPALFGIHDLHYKDLAARLGTEQPIYGLRYGLAAHTRDGVAVLPSRIEDLASHYIQEMRALQPEGPYHLMGLSFGGVVAFEMAQQLFVQRQEVALLALFDSYLVATEHRLPPGRILSNVVTLGPGALMGRLKQRAIRAKARFRKGGYQPHLHHPWGVQRDLANAYQPRIYPGKVVLFKATDPMPTVFHAFDPPEVGWQRWAAGGCEIRTVAGGHIDMLDEPNVRDVAESLSRLLAK